MTKKNIVCPPAAHVIDFSCIHSGLVTLVHQEFFKINRTRSLIELTIFKALGFYGKMPDILQSARYSQHVDKSLTRVMVKQLLRFLFPLHNP